ncbi:hypothetical protein [Maribacter ulvicola]|uniref:Uncharacterized protein n=1 Tax=Maribacter ulvicola TaxID=228959 RepID=A0A1N6ZEJ7_9FLAO|nr:hypothetical protein [Maribacter ulvicola]SIR25228.1 hypothetical protein SAMN05421797_108156 [Maribacter ulvicola]
MLLLVTIYCFGLFSTANTVPFSNNTILGESSDQKTFFAESTKLLSPHAQQSEISVADVAEVTAPNYKLPFTSFSNATNTTEVVFSSRYKQYVFYAKNLLIRHRKSDLIFPFHNFW